MRLERCHVAWRHSDGETRTRWGVREGRLSCPPPRWLMGLEYYVLSPHHVTKQMRLFDVNMPGCSIWCMIPLYSMWSLHFKPLTSEVMPYIWDFNICRYAKLDGSRLKGKGCRKSRMFVTDVSSIRRCRKRHVEPSKYACRLWKSHGNDSKCTSTWEKNTGNIQVDFKD